MSLRRIQFHEIDLEMNRGTYKECREVIVIIILLDIPILCIEIHCSSIEGLHNAEAEHRVVITIIILAIFAVEGGLSLWHEGALYATIQVPVVFVGCYAGSFPVTTRERQEEAGRNVHDRGRSLHDLEVTTTGLFRIRITDTSRYAEGIVLCAIAQGNVPILIIGDDRSIRAAVRIVTPAGRKDETVDRGRVIANSITTPAVKVAVSAADRCRVGRILICA